ncbi:MAG TPA: GH116 family glycosyl hydrolase, partial [Nakamurella multipartita]|nr:GH116 family glycosyl hydrolase [Nakamurella multipartita]
LMGWEGCCDRGGCCHGSCTHVWNYDLATPLLFGALARTMRDVEFGHATDERGLMSFRVHLPLSRAREWRYAAADGQMGCLIKLYREWRLSGDAEFLRRLWPAARRALEFCWVPGGWDADRDGLMEGCQHNTMDVEYYGPNPQMTGLYLGALRAGEEMARAVGDPEFAATCRDLFTKGREAMGRLLFNGDYYEHEIRPPAPGSTWWWRPRTWCGAPWRTWCWPAR